MDLVDVLCAGVVMTDEELLAKVAPYDRIGPTPVYTKYQVLQLLRLLRREMSGKKDEIVGRN